MKYLTLYRTVGEALTTKTNKFLIFEVLDKIFLSLQFSSNMTCVTGAVLQRALESDLAQHW